MKKKATTATDVEDGDAGLGDGGHGAERMRPAIHSINKGPRR